MIGRVLRNRSLLTVLVVLFLMAVVGGVAMMVNPKFKANVARTLPGSVINPCVLEPNGDCAGFNLSQRNLSGVDLHGVSLVGTDLRGVDLSNANLSGANLQGADLRGTNLTGANLQGANLTSAKLGLWVPESGIGEFRTDLTKANLLKATGVPPVEELWKLDVRVCMTTMPDGKVEACG